MRILIATPLYPPDIAEPAPYVKELATRLKLSHEVAILAYNHIPEQIDGVRIITVEKNKPLFIRLFHYTLALLSISRNVDLVYVQNGPSAEFPLFFVSFFVRTPFILRLGDEPSFLHSYKHPFRKMLIAFTLKRAQKIIFHDTQTKVSDYLEKDQNKSIKTTRPYLRPEILPFVSYPTDAFAQYEFSWKKHLEEIQTVFTL